MIDKLKSFFFWLTTPVQKLLQRIGKQEPKITYDDVNNIIKIIEWGDILLSYESGRPTSWLIPGFYDHAAIMSSRGTVIEAVGDKKVAGVNVGGVREVGLAEWLYKKDSVCIVRPVFKKKYTKKNPNMKAAEHALDYIGLKYDYSFDIDDEKIYCSELVYLAYKKFCPEFMDHIDVRKEILPIDYYNMCFDSPSKNLFFKLVIEVRN